MTAHVTDTRPFHQRIGGAKVKHLVNVLKHLCNGSIGFDAYRDERTNSKEKIAAYILANFSPEAIDKAHEAALATYGNGNGYRPRPRPSVSAPAPAPFLPAPDAAAVDAALGDFNPGVSVPAFAPAVPAVPAIPAAPVGGDLLGGLAALISSLVAQQVAAHMESVRREVAAIAESVALNTSGASAKPISIQIGDLPAIECGIQHKNFTKLMRACNARLRNGARLNIWLAGPAGTGKTTAAEKVAEAMGLPFHYNGALETRYELLGFVDANGRAVRTAFRDAWEHGGIYLFDEIDGSNPGALLALNGALANGSCPFPDALVKRHPDCVIIAGANTTGLGATVEYVGRMKQDAALLNRFVFIDWPLDDALEDALCADKGWLRRVQSVRGKVADKGIKGHLITPRATLYGEALLAAGMTREDVEAAVLRQGMTADQWSQVR
jgi:cobaltochelatase CobS